MSATDGARVPHRVGRRAVRGLAGDATGHASRQGPREAILGLVVENARLRADQRALRLERELLHRRLAQAERERNRIERDLHDGGQQRLVALRLRLGTLQQAVVDDPESVGPGLALAGQELERALSEIRLLAQGIYPSELRDFGLRTALASVARMSPLDVALDIGRCPRFSSEVEAAVYFCCLEGLQNAAKHGGAGVRAEITLHYRHDGGLEFAITDCGAGFSPDTIGETTGIAGMRDRIAAIGGRLVVRSSPGRGTTLIGYVPGGRLLAQDPLGSG